jgi:hypothetical protein
MKNLEIEKILKEIIATDERYSDTIKGLSSYESLINDISNNYSNDELEALQYLFEELGRNIQYDILPNKTVKEYRVGIENTKDDRKNNIKLRVYCRKILKLSDKDKWFDTDNLHQETTIMPFYKNKYETIKPIYEELDEICFKFNITNKDEAENKIEEYTWMKREKSI